MKTQSFNPSETSQPVKADEVNPEVSTHSAAPVLISVVMPCLNEATTVGACIERAHQGCQRALGQRSEERGLESQDAGGYEIIIADNGSTDASAFESLSRGAKVVDVLDRGYGAALQGGIAAAQGKYIVMADCDGSYDFLEIPRFLEKLEEGHDLVMGNRFSGQIIDGAMPWLHRAVGNPLLSGIGRLLSRAPCRDFHCGLRAFDRQAIVDLQLQSPGMEYASELVIRSAQSKLRIAEFPIVLHPDGREGSPHLRTFRDGARHLCLMLKCFFTKPRSAKRASQPVWFGKNAGFQMACGLIVALSIFLLTFLRPKNDVDVPQLDRPIPPGESISASAESFFSGAAAEVGGRIEFFYAVHDGKDHEGHELRSVATTYRGRAERTYELSESSLDFGEVNGDQDLTRTIAIRSLDPAAPIVIEGVESPHHDIQFDDISAGQFAFRLTPSEDSSTGDFGNRRATIIVKTSCIARPVARIPVHWRFMPDFRIEPKLLSVRANADEVKKLEIISKRPATIEVVQSPAGCRVASTGEQEPSTNIELIFNCKV